MACLLIAGKRSDALNVYITPWHKSCKPKPKVECLNGRHLSACVCVSVCVGECASVCVCVCLPFLVTYMRA